MTHATRLESLYEFITGEDQEQICAEAKDQRCLEAPHNFLINAINGTITKFADQLSSPGLVLPWFLDALGVPATITGFLTPVRRAGALLPQLAISGQIRRFPVHKWFWMVGGMVFGLMLVLMVPAADLFDPLTAGVVIVGLLALGSLGRGFSSVAFKDVLAKTIPEGNRGMLLAVRATTGGLLALLAGMFLRLQVAERQDIATYDWLVAGAGLLWIGSAILVGLIAEEPGEQAPGRNPLAELSAGWQLFQAQPLIRRFILARAMLLSIELSLPFYALFSRRLTGGGAGDLGIFVIAASLAQVLSSPFWGRLADRSSHQVMAAGALLAGLAGGLALLVGNLPGWSSNPYLLAVPVMLVGFAIAGVRLGRKTYLVDSAPEGDRPLYFALVNTVIGVLTLVGGVFGFIAQRFGLNWLLALLVALAILGVVFSWRLPETSRASASS